MNDNVNKEKVIKFYDSLSYKKQKKFISLLNSLTPLLIENNESSISKSSSNNRQVKKSNKKAL